MVRGAFFCDELSPLTCTRRVQVAIGGISSSPGIAMDSPTEPIACGASVVIASSRHEYPPLAKDITTRNDDDDDNATDNTRIFVVVVQKAVTRFGQ